MSREDFKGDEGMEGLDDALGDVILRKTYAQKQALEAHNSAISELRDEVERLKRLMDTNVVKKDDYLREATQVRADATEAAALAREVRSELTASGPLLRDELLKTLRDEMAAGITAQQALATSHAKVLAELQGSSSGHEGRISNSEQWMTSVRTRHPTHTNTHQSNPRTRRRHLLLDRRRRPRPARLARVARGRRRTADGTGRFGGRFFFRGRDVCIRCAAAECARR
jgi:hypothetical protein